MVAPRFLTVSRGAADLRAEAREDAELVHQVHVGELLTLLASRGPWHFVQAEDHYFGWIHGSAAAAQATSATVARAVAVPLADVRAEPDLSAAVVDRAPAGAWLAIARRTDRRGWVAVANGWIQAADTVAYNDLPRRPPTADDLIATAEAFLGVPYLWGGTTAAGMDCSGFVQQVYRLNGVRLDRDAHQQAVEGRPVDVPARGDLVFFGKTRITHVGIALEERAMLNALGGGHVQRDAIDGIGVGMLAVRRYLP